MNSLRSAGFALVDIKKNAYLGHFCSGVTCQIRELHQSFMEAHYSHRKKKLIQNFELALPVSSVKVYNFLVTTKLKQKAEGISCPTVPHKHIDTFFAVIIAFKAEEPGTNVFTFAIHW